MLSVAIVDANAKANKNYSQYQLTSVVSRWLEWECQKKNINIVDMGKADIVFVCHAGIVDWVKRIKTIRSKAPRGYLITGGAIDTAPLTALKYCDAVVIGEAYRFVRHILNLCRRENSIDAIREFIIQYEHAIERSQISELERDMQNLCLLQDIPSHLASPDEFVDWNVPPVLSDDDCVRLIASKGCRMKCKFCATTWRQPYLVSPYGKRLAAIASRLQSEKRKVMLITNDAAALPFLGEVAHTKLSAQSLSYHALKDESVIMDIIKSKPRIVRIGVEGISHRIRVAVGKPILTDRLLFILKMFQKARINTHLFFIHGMPYTNDSDWEEFKDLYLQLVSQCKWGITRLKFTTFNPQPPTPMTRFIQPANQDTKMQKFLEWAKFNCATKHIMRIQGRRNKKWQLDYGDTFDVSKSYIEFMQSSRDTTDIAPSLGEFGRLGSELVRWPSSAKTRWLLGNKYKQMMLNRS